MQLHTGVEQAEQGLVVAPIAGVVVDLSKYPHFKRG